MFFVFVFCFFVLFCFVFCFVFVVVVVVCFVFPVVFCNLGPISKGFSTSITADFATFSRFLGNGTLLRIFLTKMGFTSEDIW